MLPRSTLLAAVVSLGVTHPAHADPSRGPHLGLALGTDGGITLADHDARLVDPGAKAVNARPTVALGIALGVYYLPHPTFAVGFKMDAVLYGAGQAPTPGLNFAIGPSLVWRPGPVQVVVDPSLVLAAYDDRCAEGSTFSAASGVACAATRKAEPATIGFGGALSVLVPFYRNPLGIDLLVGPTVRYQRTHFDYDPGPGTLDLSLLQFTLGVHFFGHAEMTDTPPTVPKR